MKHNHNYTCKFIFLINNFQKCDSLMKKLQDNEARLKLESAEKVKAVEDINLQKKGAEKKIEKVPYIAKGSDV